MSVEERFADVGQCASTGRRVRLCYQVFGTPAGKPASTTTTAGGGVGSTASQPQLPCILLLQCIATPGVMWADSFCQALAGAGPYMVVRFDYRDTGLSTHWDEADDNNNHTNSTTMEQPPAMGTTTNSSEEHGKSEDGDIMSLLDSDSSDSDTEASRTKRGRTPRGMASTAAASMSRPTSAPPSSSPSSVYPPVPSTHVGYISFAYAVLKPGKGALPVVYTLDDMARDALELLSVLGVSDAHLVGISLGGVVSQCMALLQPQRVRSMTLIATQVGDPELTQWPSLREMLSFISLVPRSISTKYAPRIAAAKNEAERQRLVRERDAERVRVYAHCFARFLERISGDTKSYPFNMAATQARIEKVFARSLYTKGAVRHLAALLDASPRSQALKTRITSVTPSFGQGAVVSSPSSSSSSSSSVSPRTYIPTLVVHGTKDGICPPKNGENVAKSIPGSKLMMINGMGHAIPPALHDRLIRMILENVQQGERFNPRASLKVQQQVNPSVAAGVMRSFMRRSNL